MEFLINPRFWYEEHNTIMMPNEQEQDQDQLHEVKVVKSRSADEKVEFRQH